MHHFDTICGNMSKRHWDRRERCWWERGDDSQWEVVSPVIFLPFGLRQQSIFSKKINPSKLTSRGEFLSQGRTLRATSQCATPLLWHSAMTSASWPAIAATFNSENNALSQATMRPQRLNASRRSRGRCAQPLSSLALGSGRRTSFHFWYRSI